MCIILDTNLYGAFINSNNEDMQPVRDWMNRKNGKIAYSPVGKIAEELKGKMKGKFEVYEKAGKLKRFSKEDVERKKEGLEGLISDDPDIIALAQVSNVKVLVSRDKKLHKDFTNTNIIEQGKIYQTKRHEHLLRKDTCP